LLKWSGQGSNGAAHHPNPVRRSPLLLDDIRTLLAPTELVARSWPAGIAEADMAILLMGFAAARWVQ
jgi:hypothetical protein